jgi:hypothetical protein
MVPAITTLGIIYQRSDGIKFRIVPSIPEYYDYIDEHSDDGMLPDDIGDYWIVMPSIHQGLMSFVDYYGNEYDRRTLALLSYANDGFIDED